MPYFSIIMQSTLKPYPGAATNRPEKLIRAIESVINQTFQEWELIVVADNCQQTFDIADKYLRENIIAEKYSEPKNDKWSAYCRNVGKDLATGKYILYLDNDDYYAPDYLQNLYNEISKTEKKLYFVDHYEWVKNEFRMIRARLTANNAGTANIVHSSQIKSRWPDIGTRGMEDWTFIKRLINESPQYEHLSIAGYYVCHKTGIYDI